MSQPLPEGYVDPLSASQVAPVIEATLRMGGLDGLAELLVRIPGIKSVPGKPARFMRAAEPPEVWIGQEHRLALLDPVVHQHIVGGVVLSRDAVGTGALPSTLARLIGTVVRDAGGERDASVALTAARDTYGAM